MNTQIAIAFVVVVALAIGGFVLAQHLEAQRRAAQRSDPAALIAGGVANIIGGIVEAAT